MVLSILARRFALSTTTGLAAHAIAPATLTSLTRRTFLTTARVQNPPVATKAKSSKAKTTAKTTKKATSTKKGETKAKKVSKPAKEKDAKPIIPRILRAELPPKRPPGAYLLFYLSYLKSQPKSTSREQSQEHVKRAAEIWKTYTAAEKQPFVDENAVLVEQWTKDVEEFWQNKSISETKELNARRRLQGKPVFHHPNEVPRPMSSYMLFLQEFRDSPDAKAITSNPPDGRNASVAVVKAGAERWRSMSKAEQAPYVEKSERARAEYKTQQETA
ncbi:hypothetical protein HYDPIDRAFT_30503 [Hydnomerulius pinastri MD-312]|uniref:Unplaced genomic scaffold scaffold_22, whole genome shotgun sequence n=1 Tax=Hydnomerulius pinastri MD-312 TaxID=994086 RepID=A0A0C9W624_9AGAM|nr:hypothetical protein HYDPIDRAFT_30503 [Hydnomerulius pinastri MD-312]